MNNELQRTTDWFPAMGFQKSEIKNLDQLESMFYILTEEVQELAIAMANNDKEETADALADIIVVACNISYNLDIDIHQVLARVNDANYRKMYSNQEDLDADRKTYEGYGLEVSQSGMCLYSAKDQALGGQKKYPKGKLIKPLDWKGPASPYHHQRLSEGENFVDLIDRLMEEG